jgi:membrane peptidoglycan carboxypeptidase
LIGVLSGIKLENLFDLSNCTQTALAASLNAAFVAIFMNVQIEQTF